MTQFADLSDCHDLVSPDKDTGCGFYISARQFPGGHVEAMAIRLDPDDHIKRSVDRTRKNSDKDSMTEQALAKSRSRAKTKVRHKALSMQADRMLTLTFRQNVTDVDEAWRCFSAFNKKMKWRYKDKWVYIAVPELQKRGAVHFHLAIKGYFHVETLRRFWLQAAGDRGGSVNITSPRSHGKNSWNPKRIASYLAKYMTKTDVVSFNKKRYSSGGNIEVPEPLTGWLALGVPIDSVLWDIFQKLTRKPLNQRWESQGYYHLFWYST